ncbi:hypothetical protein Ancab_033717 [Ancistrocladus abbreviatus]
MHLVKAFERLLSIALDSEKRDEKELEEKKKGVKWALPGLQEEPKASKTEDSSSSFYLGDLFITAESLGLDSRVSSSLDYNQGRVWRKQQLKLHLLSHPTENRGVFQAEVLLEATGAGGLRAVGSRSSSN